MARFKPIDMSPRFLAVDLHSQVLPGTFEYALCHLIDHELDLSELEARLSNDACGAPAYAPSVLLKIVLLAYLHRWLAQIQSHRQRIGQDGDQ